MAVSRSLLPLLLLVGVVMHASAARRGGGPLTPAAAARHGVATMRLQCKRQAQLLPALVSAVAANDLSRARAAYIAARPPYEQIEVLAPAFPFIDRDIDARPYAFRKGEDDADFRGFHWLERALFRDNRLGAPALNVAKRLVRSVDALCEALKDGKRFSAAVAFEGAIALAFEVPAKKVASEEEAWSDLSLMIFRSNFRGVWAQISPFLRTPRVQHATVARIKRAYRNVRGVMDAVDPRHPFYYKGGEARPYSKVSLKERKTIIDAAYVFAAAAEAVRDEVMPRVTRTALVPTHLPVMDTSLRRIANGKYVKETREGLTRYHALCQKQQKLVAALLRTLRSKKALHPARRAYARARPPYEQIETIAGNFPSLDANIDARPYALARGELDRDWRGFHAVERALFRDSDRWTAVRATRVVQGDVDSLCGVLRKGAAGRGGGFSAAGHFDGMITLAYEVPAKKISSEEETWSDLSVMIFRENAKGIYAIFEPFAGRLPAAVAVEVKRAYSDIRVFFSTVVDRRNDFDKGSKFVKYSKVPTWQRGMISAKFYRLGRGLVRARASLARA